MLNMHMEVFDIFSLKIYAGILLVTFRCQRSVKDLKNEVIGKECCSQCCVEEGVTWLDRKIKMFITKLYLSFVTEGRGGGSTIGFLAKIHLTSGIPQRGLA